MDIKEWANSYSMDIRDPKRAYSLFASEIQHAQSEVSEIKERGSLFVSSRINDIER
jgi:hypothetical protein